MATWEANGSSPLVAGETYRVRATVRGPYNAVYVGLMRSAFRFECFARGWEYVSTDSAPPMVSAHSGTFTPWTATFTFRPGGAPGVQEAGLDVRTLAALAGVIVAAALALTLVEPRLEHLVTSIGKNIIQPITQPLSSPLSLLLIGAAVVGSLYFLRKG